MILLYNIMRKVTIFELQSKIGKQLEELPFQITRYGKVIAVVNRFNVTTPEPSYITSPENKTPKVVQQDYLLSMAEGKLKELEK
jgi:hypothetical protein